MAIKQKQKYINQYKTNPNYKKDTHLKPGEPNPKDIGIDGYEYEEDILEDYEPSKTKEF